MHLNGFLHIPRHQKQNNSFVTIERMQRYIEHNLFPNTALVLH